MDETRRSNHCFESTAASGAVIYMIDNGAPVCLKFNSYVKIEVVFDAFSHPSKTPVAEDFDHVQDNVATDQTEPAVVESVFGGDHQHHGHSDVHDHDLIAENSQENMVQTSGLATTWEPKKRTVKRGKVFGESESADFPKIVTKSNRELVKQKPCSKENGQNSEENEKCYEHIQEGGSVCSNIDGGPGSDYHNKVYNTKLRSSNRLVKLNTKSHTHVQASKAAKTLLKTTIRKSSNNSKKYLVKHTRSPAKELAEHSERLSQVTERPRKLLMNKTVKCEYCAKDFQNQQAFYDHRRAEESTHKCGICGKVEPYEAHLIVHMQKHRRTKEGSQSHNPLKSSNSKSQLAADCDNKSFSAQKKSKKEKMKCNFCGLVVSSMDSLKIHTFLHTGEHAYCCCVCGEHFSSLSSRQHHMDTHISAQRFKCNPCGERFTSRAELAKHQLTHEIKCALCGEIFPNKTSRTCHFRVSHASDILKCSLCANLFATVEDLQKHLTYHKKGKKEQCPVCGVVVSKLKDHMLMHSQVAQEKLYACDQCPMRYLRKSNLDRHIRTHTGEKPYACNKCPKSFRSNGMLRKHLLTHTKERPYQCEVCGKQCSLRSNLNIHMRVHNNDRYFCCPLCSQAFNHKNSLHGHMKNKHAHEGDLQDRHLNISVRSVHQSEMTASNVVTERDKAVSFDQKPFQNLAMPFISRNTDSGLLKLERLDGIQDFHQVQPQLNFALDKPASMNADMLLLADRYDMHTHSSHNPSY